MIVDPLTVWNGQFPYDALEPAGITPASSREDVEQASFTLMTARMMTPATQKAWQELRDMRQRLVVDFLLYDVDPAAEFGQARAAIQRQLAGHGEPPGLDGAFTVPVDLLHGLADELTEAGLDPPPPPDVPDGLRALPSHDFLDGLVHFDR